MNNSPRENLAKPDEHDVKAWSEKTNNEFLSAGKEIEWAEHNPYVKDALIASAASVGAIAVIASRGKLLGAAEKLFPKTSELLEETTATAPDVFKLAPLERHATDEEFSAQSQSLPRGMRPHMPLQFRLQIPETMPRRPLTEASTGQEPLTATQNSLSLQKIWTGPKPLITATRTLSTPDAWLQTMASDYRRTATDR